MEPVAVIIPTLNEAAAIGGVVAEIPRTIARQIIVADSGSRDRTAAVATGAGRAVSAAESSLALAAEQRAEAEAASASGTEAIKAVRAQLSVVSGELDKVVNTAHGTEISRNEHRLRLRPRRPLPRA